MAEDTRRVTWTVERPAFDMRSLVRLGVWGGLASAAMGLAVIAAYSGTGSQGVAAADRATSRPAAVDPDTAAQAARTADDLRRLADLLHTLAADRDQLLTRIASVEHGLEDVTGSIKRDATTGQPRPDAAGAAAAPSHATETNPGATPDAANRAAETPGEPLAAMVGLGVDVGGAVNFDGLRTLWFSTKRNNPALPEDLFPVVAARENNKTRSVDLRLIVGPLANAEAAVRLCATLSAAHRYCQMVAFEGQRLSLIESAPKASAASGHRPTLGP